MEIYGRIYKITNLINNKEYIGQTVDTIKARFSEHCKSKKQVISKAIRKYGRKNFKIEEIDIAYNQEELNLIEGIYMSWFNTLAPNGYNIKKIIDGKGRHSEETKEKIKIASNMPERLKIASENGKKCRGKPIKGSKYKYVGIYKAGKKHVSCICYNNRTICLGNYNDEIEAAKAYDIAAIKYFGNDATLNFTELREDYINDKIIVKKCSKHDNSKSGIKGINFDKSRNRWQVRWFDKQLNKKKTKNFKDLKKAVEFKLLIDN